MTAKQAEIETVEALCKHARTLRHNHNPRLAIAAANWEIRLQEELEKLGLTVKRSRDKRASAEPLAAAGVGE